MTNPIELRKKINEIMSHYWGEEYETILGVIYNILYGKYQNENTTINALHFTQEGKLIVIPKHLVNYDNNKYGDFDSSKTMDNLLKNKECICIPTSDNTYLVFGVYTHFLFDVSVAGVNGRIYRIDVFTDNIDEFVKAIGNDFVFKNKTSDKPEFGILSIGDDSIYTSYFDLKVKYNVDIKKHYNDDIPYDEIVNCIKDDTRSDLILFYGEPGTGKSSIIKKLIVDCDDNEFVFCDSRILAGMNPSKFISWVVDNPGMVIVLEDCEKLLASRDTSNNSVMSMILNITDGVIADVLGIKLICTFNTDIANIDKALLRKGRLSIKYCFNKLDVEKCKAINPEAKTAMSLADLFNDKENDYSQKKTKKIGF